MKNKTQFIINGKFAGNTPAEAFNAWSKDMDLTGLAKYDNAKYDTSKLAMLEHARYLLKAKNSKVMYLNKLSCAENNENNKALIEFITDTSSSLIIFIKKDLIDNEFVRINEVLFDYIKKEMKVCQTNEFYDSITNCYVYTVLR